MPRPGPCGVSASCGPGEMMRALPSDLPIVLDNISVVAGDVTILDRISLTLESGGPTVLVGPNGSGQIMVIRVGMGLVAPASGVITWGGNSSDGRRRAMVFQRPVMLRRTAIANISYALGTVGIARQNRNGHALDLLDQVSLAELAQRP